MKAWAYLLVLSAACTAPVAAQEADGGHGSRQVTVAPYIEANQIFTAELSPGDDVVTYTQVAAGVDVNVQGRNHGAAASVRVEHTFGYDNGVPDATLLSGMARGYASVVPNAVTIEAGGLATRTVVDGNGGSTIGAARNLDAESRVYSAFAGPTVHTSAGDAEINANYRIGYTRVEEPDAFVAAPGLPSVDLFDESVAQTAGIHVGTRAGEPLPVGLGVGAGFYQEDVSNLDQRVRDAHVRADISVPVTASLEAVGGVGYEDVEVSSRDAVRDAAGNPVLGSDGRFVTDDSAPRQLAYDVSGLIWDVGVIWRPSSRTSAEAHIGERYDSLTYYGSFAWAPSSRSSVNLSVYDGITGFGGQVGNALASLPTDFAANRNPITGDVTGCVASLSGNNCLSGLFGSLRSALFRGRGITASYSEQVGRSSAGIAAGYNRRKFIAAPGTVLASADGLVDESLWAAVYLSAQIDARSSFSLDSYVNWISSGNAGEATVLGTSAAYERYLLDRLSAHAAVSLDGVDSDTANGDQTTASALLGLRYDF